MSSPLDDAIAQVAAAQVAYDIANTNRYNAQMLSESAANALGLAKTNYETALAEHVASINTPEVVAAAKAATSTVTDLLLVERNAGIKGGAIFVKANPMASQNEVVAAWTDAAKAATNLPALLQDPHVLFMLYGANLKEKGYIPDPTWDSVVAWIINTPLEFILSL
jgi:hypothetical protein